MPLGDAGWAFQIAALDSLVWMLPRVRFPKHQAHTTSNCKALGQEVAIAQGKRPAGDVHTWTGVGLFCTEHPEEDRKEGLCWIALEGLSSTNCVPKAMWQEASEGSAT
ncbi:unnamed protein product [Symbiodinium natans]|uniref:Uncharacterized protein n=1 Tax=Symbiodinium natans TaxID=878477 RepID=A0A812RJ45_9DINO|nr:unnamed protein product [Symbiodinium natans]